MSELRHNIITRDWVIIAKERAKRPQEFKKAAAKVSELPRLKSDCPFCPGNEVSNEETFRVGDKKTWKARSLSNKYPALSPDRSCDRKTEGIYNCMDGYGFHEVMVENPRHDLTLAIMSDEEVETVIRMYKNRYEALGAMKCVESVTIFKNHGSAAGASIEHPHSQVVATPMVPPLLRNRVEKAADYYDLEGKCLFCNVLGEELVDRKRIVLETGHFVSFVPYAAPAPFVISLFPRKHRPSFDQITDDEIKDLSGHLRIILAKLYRGLDNPDYNLTIRSVPVKERDVEYYHWFISIVPRIFEPAGFELGSGIFINTGIPEDNAAFLREVAVS